MDPSHTDEITRFVRGTLGCQCPDAVFRSIGIAHEHTPDDGAPFTRLLVGDRLLIYLVQSCARAATPDTLTALARQGRAERDAKGYNRFRLVLVSHDPAADAAARTTFETTLGHDDKAHLHVVPSAEIPLDLECARLYANPFPGHRPVHPRYACTAHRVPSRYRDAPASCFSTSTKRR